MIVLNNVVRTKGKVIYPDDKWKGKGVRRKRREKKKKKKKM
jgi:hypothetical protein